MFNCLFASWKYFFLSISVYCLSPSITEPKRLFEIFAYEISIPITFIFNLFKSKSFHLLWKRATITALQKVKVITQLIELRLLPLTPDLGKILEGFMAGMALEDTRSNIIPIAIWKFYREIPYTLYDLLLIRHDIERCRLQLRE